MNIPLRRAAKIAWRESRASSAKFLFVILAVGVGVGALTGVRGFSRAFHGLLMKEARTLLAADLSVRVFALPTTAQQAALDGLAARGVRHTWITETITMMAKAGSGQPLLVSVKAVDGSQYPYYGAVSLEPAMTLAEALKADTVAVGEDLLLRLDAHVGDSVRIGGQDFRIRAVVKSEPDRMAGSLNVGPRVMMSRAGLDRTGLIIVGSRASERFLFRVPARVAIESVRAELKRTFRDALIADYRQAHPLIEQGLEHSTTFLSLVSLIALIVGALGVAMAMQAHLQQKLDSIAIMKCLGARSNQVMSIYIIQTAGLGLAGGLLGVLFGAVVQLFFPVLIARYFTLRPSYAFDWVVALEGLSIGMLTCLLFTVPPLLSIRKVKPSAIFRRDMQEVRPNWRARWKADRASWAAAAVIALAIGSLAGWLAESVRAGIYFAGGLAISLALLTGVAKLLLRGLRRLVRQGPRWLWVRPSLRHGIANLYRPGNHAEAALVALGIGVMFTLTVFLVQHGMLTDMLRSAPPGMPNVFFLDITPKQKDAVAGLIAQQKGIKTAPEFVGTAAGTIATINGTPVEKLNLAGHARRFAHSQSLSEVSERPPEVRVLEGAWWSRRTLAGQHSGAPVPHGGAGSAGDATPRMAVAEDVAKNLHLRPGTRVEWWTPARRFEAVVSAVYKPETARLSSRVEFLFTPGALAGLPVIYYGSVRVQPERVGAMQRALYQRFPTVTVVNVADVVRIMQEVVDQIAVVVRFISAFSILAGVIILASSVAGTSFRRVREVAIMKTVGAKRRMIAEIFSLEFLVLGGVAGLIGALLANAFSYLLLRRFMDLPSGFNLDSTAAAIGLSGLVAVAAGWAASIRILEQKPLEILREQ